MPFWLFNKVARKQGVDAFTIAAFREYMEDMKAGAFAFEGGTTDTVEALTGAPAESFETTARRYAAQPFARQTFANRLKALATFSAAPFLPGYDLARLAKDGAFPIPPRPTRALEDLRWRTEHQSIMADQPLPGRSGEKLALRVAT